MARSTYCAVSDILTGDLPLPTYLSPIKFVEDAADEIDSMIGFRYTIPVDVSATSTVKAPGILLLKRLNSHIATGRLLMAADQSGEETDVHKYALFLLQSALTTLQNISDGVVTLPGAGTAPVDPNNPQTVPLLYNKDIESGVEAFYDRVANPWYPVTHGYRWAEAESPHGPGYGGGLVR